MKKLKNNISINSDDIVKLIKKNGIAEIDDFLDQETLYQLQEYIYSEINSNPKGYSGSVGKEAVKGSPLEYLDRDFGIMELLQELHSKSFPKKESNKNSLQVLKVQSGGGISGKKNGYMFHYDAYLLTALLPIIIPNRDDGLNGDFMYLKQRRNYHNNLVRNIIEKFIIQNPFTRYLLSRKTIQNFFNLKICKIKPGKLYVFYGFQTIHGNGVINSITPRATAIFHYSDPMNGHFIVSRNEKTNRSKINNLGRFKKNTKHI